MLKAYGLIAAGVAVTVGMGAASAACASSASDAGGFQSGGTASSSGGFDAGGFDGATLGSPDTGSDAADAGPLPTSALFVNAMPSALTLDSAVRLCWGKRGSDGGIAFDPNLEPFPSDAPMPESNYPGIPLGGAVVLADASALEAGVALVAIRARPLAELGNDLQGKAYTCQELLGPPRIDSFALGDIAIPSHLPTLVAIGGCGPVVFSPGATNQACGASWDNAHGNLHAEVLSITPSNGSAGTLGFQVAQLSPALGDLIADGGAPAQVWFGSAATPSGGTLIATVAGEGEVAPMTPQSVLFDGSAASYDGLGFQLQLPNGDGGSGLPFLSLLQAMQLADPIADPAAYYGASGTYVVALVGDPAAPPPFASSADGGVYDGTGLHFVVVPAQP
jgi:hypothetical protein